MKKAMRVFIFQKLKLGPIYLSKIFLDMSTNFFRLDTK